jgi:exodeoxyribonuclease VII large subunit
MHNNPSDRQIYSVSQLNRSVRHLLETQLPLLWVEGEISNFARPASGHWYLSLKDEQAQVRCAMFRNANQRVNFQPSNGTQILVRCRAGLYEGRGEYQLIIEHMEEAGFGALQRKFEQLKQQLTNEGLFDNQHKRPMPTSVSHIGVITSATGAAVKDILSVLHRRFPAIKVSIFPTAVQGEQAAAQIIDALAMANQQGQCDALIVGRGGGSLEDLWPFNEESVARAIFNSEIPVVSAVGHEVDFTIADFVADLRAPTPSAAAELLSPDGEDLLNQFMGFEVLLSEALIRIIRQREQRTDYLQKRLQHPGKKLQQQSQHMAHLQIRLQRAIAGQLQQQRATIDQLQNKLLGQSPEQTISYGQQRITQSVKHLMRSIQQQLANKQTKTNQAMHLLDTVSPLSTLGRGYAIIRDQHNTVIKTVNEVSAGDQLTGQLADGEIVVSVSATTTKTL